MSDLALSPPASARGATGRRRVVRAVAAKELLEMARDRRLLWLYGFIVFLMIMALAFGAVENTRLMLDREAAVGADRTLWTGQGAKDPHAAAHYGQYAFKPLSPLALADPGVDAYVGSAVLLEAHKQNEAQFRMARDAGVGARLGSLSLAFILQTIAPLIIILIGFASISGERESGTLKQLMSLGARPRDIVAGKALALGGALFALLGPAVIGAALAVALLTDTTRMLLVDQFARLGALGFFYAIYLAGFALLALAVSALARTSRAALVALLAFWLVNSFVAPRLMTDAARGFAPTPTAQEFHKVIAKEKAQSFGYDESHQAYVAFRAETLKNYGVSRIEDLPVSFRGLTLRKDDELGYAIFDRHFSALQAAFATQDTLRATPGFLFPMLAIRPVSMALAGADNWTQYDFATTAEAHRRAIQNEVSGDIIQFFHDARNVAEPELWKRIAAFSYRAPDIGFALGNSGRASATLLGWLVLTAALALWAARRLRPI